MKKNYFLKQVNVALLTLCKLQKTMALTLLMLMLVGGYAAAQQCSVPSYSDLMSSGSMEVACTSYTGGGSFDAYWTGTSTISLPITKYNPDSTGGVWSVVEGPFAWGQNSQNINYLQIYGPGPENANVYFTGAISVTSPACFYFVGYNSNNTFDVLDSYNSSEYYPFQINCSGLHYFKYYLIVKGGGTRYIKMQISKTPQLLHLAPAQNQDDEGPKVVNLTELLTPVMGTNGPESFPFMYQATAAWGDFNNDGYLDLIMMGMYEKYFDFDDDGNPIPNIDEDGNEIPLPDGEITYDTWQAVTCTRLYMNNGDGTFTQVAHPFPNLRRGAVAWLDYDNDGNLDVIMFGLRQDGSRFTGIFRNQGPDKDYSFAEELPGEFEYLEIDSDDRATRMIAVGDYDNDGWVDIALTGRSADGRRVSLYHNLEGQGFQKMEYLVDGNPFVQQNGGTIAWGDYNRDGFLDLITFGWLADKDQYSTLLATIPPSDNGNDNWAAGFLYKNNGDGTFAEPIMFPAGEDGDIAWGDFNNNGYLDFIFSNYSWWPSPWNDWRSFIYMNNEDGTFAAYNNDDAGIRGDQGISLALGDVNNDGYEDIVQNKAWPATAVFLNNAGELPFVRQDLLFGEDQTTLNIRSGAISLVDFNNDGALDIFANGYDDQKVQSHLLRNDLDVLEGIPANQPPSVPTNLKATVDADGMTTFTWDASTDDLTPTDALRYNLYVKQGDVIKMVLPADLTTGRLKVNETLAPIMGTTYKMSGLEGDYEWGVQAIDNGKQASKFAKITPNSLAQVNKATVSVIGKNQAIEVKAANDLQGTLNVYAVSGVKMYSKAGQINGSTVTLPAGVYIVKTTSTEGTSVNKVVVK